MGLTTHCKNGVNHTNFALSGAFPKELVDELYQTFQPTDWEILKTDAIDLEESDIEQLGIEDGTFDRDNNMSYMGSYGSSVDYENLTDEQKEAYEDGYMTGAEDYDLTTDDEDE